MPTIKPPKFPPPTFSEQTEVIVDWWKSIRNMYVTDFNSKETNPSNYKDPVLVIDIPMATIYEFLIKKRLVRDRQFAIKLITQQLGGKLQNQGKLCYEEFNKLFCRGMFKVALINTINSLQTQINGNSDCDHVLELVSQIE